MNFTETPLAGAFIIDVQVLEDERGFFARTWAAEEFQRRGIDPTLFQCNLAWNKRKGTLRGMHFQRPPFQEVKIVRCTAGSCPRRDHRSAARLADVPSMDVGRTRC